MKLNILLLFTFALQYFYYNVIVIESKKEKIKIHCTYFFINLIEDLIKNQEIKLFYFEFKRFMKSI